MIRIKLLAATALSAALLFAAPGAQAHCDSMDGPVARAALAALESGDVGLALPYAPAAAEDEVKSAFVQSMKVRGLGPDAKALADRAFVETTVRLHRAGEGAAYTGLKPAGLDYGPAIPAAERAVATGDLTPVRMLLATELEHGLHTRFAAVEQAQKIAREQNGAPDVAAARQRVSAELGFVTYVEGLNQAMHGAAGHEHRD